MKELTDSGILIGDSPELREYAKERGLEHYSSHQDYVDSTRESPSLYAFTRKSVVGALYRVGASFAADAAIFGVELDAAKLFRVAALVVGINFIDYRFDVTNRLDNAAKSLEGKITKRDLADD